MKTNLLILLTSFVLFLASCKKEKKDDAIKVPATSNTVEVLDEAKCMGYFTNVKFYTLTNNTDPVYDSCTNFGACNPEYAMYGDMTIYNHIDGTSDNTLFINNIRMPFYLGFFYDTTHAFIQGNRTYGYLPGPLAADTIAHTFTKNILLPVYFNNVVIPETLEVSQVFDTQFKVGSLGFNMSCRTRFDELNENSSKYIGGNEVINGTATIPRFYGLNLNSGNTASNDYYLVIVVLNWQKETVNGFTYYFVEEAQYRKKVHLKLI